MRYNILIGGKAGQGIDALSQLLSALFVKRGLYVFNCRDYQSLIRGGHNFNIICISDKPVHSNDSNIDLLVALDDLTFEEHKSELAEDHLVLTGNPEAKSIFLDVKQLGKAANVAFAGAVAKICGGKLDDLLNVIKTQFREEFYESNRKAAEEYFNKDYGIKVNFPESANKTAPISGSEAIARGAIDVGIQRYFGYPMTPATGVHNQLQNRQNKDLHVFNYENEIGCINAAIGASFSGKRTMTGTAGGGFDLMSEAVSFAGMAEIPIVIHLAQRPGPGTGLPTYTAQADTDIALYAGHGDFPRVVIAPGDAAEGYEKTVEAVYFAEKFNIPVIIFTDKHML
ncbi:2-oxoacid:acceptor oxidoreductase family protein, partial [Candidatus Woesearchaeota archaeon]|nr:2-oxoacid:acceptor oxidoreductase family protein [Candidatus Woesearchaeota archaeon]